MKRYRHTGGASRTKLALRGNWIDSGPSTMAGRPVPQASSSSFAPRMRTYSNSLLTPVTHSNTPANPLTRTTKRGTTVINYAEDGYDDLDDDDDDLRRRPASLRFVRRDDSSSTRAADPREKVGKDTSEPVYMQGILRDWMYKTHGRSMRTDLQNQAQAHLPLTLIPIRIDVDIPGWVPLPALPQPPHMGMSSDVAYKPGEMTVPYRLKDSFLWNLHEAIITTDQFALTLVQDLDLPNRNQIAIEVSKQIRTQLEEYAGVALHPLFHTATPVPSRAQPPTSTISTIINHSGTPVTASAQQSRADTPATNAATPAPSASASAPASKVVTSASMVTPQSTDFNPDDTYRCIMSLSISLGEQLYTDKFEWSLLHPPGTAEMFAKQTCADIGLAGEWVPVLAHAIYEAVLKLKKEACESGGVVQALELQNDAVLDTEAGWRYDPEGLGQEWEPKVEKLSKDEIGKREGDRERELRRLRRAAQGFSSNSGMFGGMPMGAGFGAFAEAQEEERMGRGERNKKRRRFRSLSPLARGGTPSGANRGTPDLQAGGYGGGGTLTDFERNSWRCSHCKVFGTCVWAVRDGPHGARVSPNAHRSSLLLSRLDQFTDEMLRADKSLCNNCGLVYEQCRKLPRWLANLHAQDPKLI